MEKPMEDTKKAPEDEEETPQRAASDVESYESEWYEVLKRRAQEPQEEDATDDDEP
jgi:hypothetical protein